MAMMKVMATQGYDGATISGIAKEAGLTSGLVHYHFGSKQEILLHMMALLIAAHTQRLNAALEAAGERRVDQLDAFINAHLAIGATADPEATAAWVSLTAEAVRQPPVGQAWSTALDTLAEHLRPIIDAGQQEGAFKVDKDDIEPAVAAILATIQGYFVLAATNRELIPRGSAAAATRQMARGLLRIQT